MQTCQDHAATNYGGTLPCKYAPQTCQDTRATNYGGTLPCKYAPQTCQDYKANNYRVSYPCTYTVKAPVVTLTADNENVAYNGTTTVRWTSQNATACFANAGTNGWTGGRALSGNFYTGALTSSTTYNITCTNTTGSDSKSVTVNVAAQAPNPTVSLTADNTNVSYGGSTTVRWSSQNATTCFAANGSNGWAGSKYTSGGFSTGALTTSMTYNITCNGATGTTPANDTVTITVNPKVYQDPTVTLFADDFDLSYGGSTNVHWTSQNATSCVASAGVNGWANPKELSGIFYTGNLTSTTSYIITCKNAAGKMVSSAIKINVSGQTAPTVSLFSDKSNVPYNGNTNIRWTSENATSCVGDGGANGWTNPKALSGIFYTGALTTDTTYNITCRNAAGQTAVASETVSVGALMIADPVVDIFADDTNVIHGGSTNVRWNSENATSCTANGGSNGWANSKTLSGIFYTGPLTMTTTYNITCKNAAGKMVSGSVKVNVDGMVGSNPTVTLYADNTNLASGGYTNVHWNSTNAVSCFANAGSNGWTGNKGLSGIFYTGALTTDTTYNITCNGSSGATASASATVFVQSPLPTVNIYANPNLVVLGNTTNLSWTSRNATSCFATDGTNTWYGSKNLMGSFVTGPITTATTFGITCSNGTGSTSDSVVVNIKPKITVITL